MHLKLKGYCFSVLLIYTITTITLAPVGWCEPTGYSSQPSPRSALHNGRGRVLLMRSLSHPPDLPNLHYLENSDRTETGTSGGRPEQTLKSKMVSSSTDKGIKSKQRQTQGERMHTSLDSPEDCSMGEMKPVIHGKFYITGQLETNTPNVGYQSDAAVSGQERVRGQRVRGSEESWQRLQPAVECGDDAMTLTVRRRRAVQLQLDRVNESSVPLSQMPPQCGYSVQTTWRDLGLMAQYDACHVTQEDDSYVLPLLWRGTPVKMSCPASQIQPQSTAAPTLCCSLHGMTVKVQGLSATEKLRVNVRGEWTPLEVLAEQCGYTLDRRDAQTVIAAPFITCGITLKNGKYTLSLQIGEKTFALACPVSPPEELPLTHQPHRRTRVPTEHMPDSLESFPWAPPFYLAPPYYPHPTYHHNFPKLNGHDAYNPPTPSPSTPNPTSGPRPLPPVDSQPDYQGSHSHQSPVRESYKHFSSLSSADDLEDSSRVYPDVHPKRETPVLGPTEKRSETHSPSSETGFQVEAPPLQPPSLPSNQYYHYYHHPKIPLPDPPQDPDPHPKVPSLTSPHNPEFPTLAPGRFNFFQPASHPSAPYPPYPPQPHPHHYFSYVPHITRGEGQRLSPLDLHMAAKTNVSDYQNRKSSTVVHPLPRSSEVHDESNLRPDKDHPNPDKMINFPKNSREWVKHPLLSDDDEAEVEPLAVPPPEQPSFPAPSPNHNLPPYPYYYHPYYHYYHMYYGPESLLNAANHVSLTSSKEALDPLLQASSSPSRHPPYHKPQTTTAPTKSIDNVHHGPLYPYYYYYYQPEVSADNQEIHPTRTMSSSPFHSLYPHDITQQHPYDAFWHPDGEEKEERLDDENKDHVKANLSTPSASPCGLGSVSGFDCSISSGCCSYPVKDCTMGQHLIFAVPDSVVEPTVAHPSEVSDVSCTLQRLTSDPDIYMVPLEGCGVNKLVFGQTVVHLLEVHGIQSFQQDHSYVPENSAVRLIVECSSSPGSSGQVRLHMIDQLPPPPIQSTPATATVQLRIATDESFTSFHPKAHLPLSLMRGRPVYVEVSLLDPPEPGLVLLVHSCLAYTQAPYTSWMLVYDGCPRWGYSQLLPSPHSDHNRRILISSFLSLPSQSPTYVANGGYSHLEDPQIFFLCLTEVCSAADGGCTVGCINSKFNTVET